MAYVRKKVLFYGYVQGVGFRYFAKMNAQRFNVTGFVENLYDGSVHMEVEGKDYIVDAYLKTLQKGNRYIDVQRMDVKAIPLKGDKSFKVRDYF